MLLALPIALGLDPIPFAHGLGLLCFAGSLVVTWWLADELTGSRAAALAAVVMLGTQPTFSAYATSGLETGLQALCFAASALMTMRILRSPAPPSVATSAGLSLLFAAALMTRLDSGLMVATLGLAVLVSLWRRGQLTIARLMWLVAPGGALTLAWFGWKVATYGSVLPNTFAAKTGSEGQLSAGLAWLWLFGTSTLAVVPLLAGVAAVVRSPPGRGTVLVALGGVWLLYVVSVGADFMEFRFIVPILPLAAVGVAWLAFSWLERPAVGAALVAFVVLGSAHHAVTWQTTDGIESIEDLAGHLTREAQDWNGVGHTLHAHLGDADVLVATTAAGAIPYHSRLPSIDMLGLTDAWIARNGEPFGAQRSHTKVAPLAYLVERGTHLVLGQPWVKLHSSHDRAHYDVRELRELHVLRGVRADELPPGSRVLEIPLDDRRAVVALQLAAHPAIDAAIEQHGWRVWRVGAPSADTRI